MQLQSCTSESSIFEQFKSDGIVFLPKLIDLDQPAEIRDESVKILTGEYSTGIAPDKIKWKPGDKETVVKSVCNAWKSSGLLWSLIENLSLYESVARMMGWNSVRLNQDSILVVPPGSSGVTFHFDNAYQDWHSPGGIATIWISLSDLTHEGSSALSYAAGSQHWHHGDRVAKFTTNGNPDSEMIHFANTAGYTLTLNSFAYNIGDASIHHGQLWHGSYQNLTPVSRFAYAIHLMNGESRFNDVTSPYFSRYRLKGTDFMDESFFPLLWRYR